MPTASAYRQTRHGEDYPANLIREYIEQNGLPDETGIAELAARVQLPGSTLRSSLSFYADFSNLAAKGCVSCNGTSCFLSAEKAAPDEGGKQVSCLGHCYRGNNELREGVIHPDPADTPFSIRCLAPVPVTTRNLLDEDCHGLDRALHHSGYEALRYALQQEPEKIIAAVTASGLRGRGGAAFPTGLKWQACAATEADQRYIIANGNEGDPGSYIDRILLEQDPHSVIEGMLLCGYAVGASKGIVFIRSEYPQAAAVMESAIAEAQSSGLFQAGDFSFELTVVHGAGSFVCGEETALLNAIEGLRGEVRLRPPYPTQAGLFGKPTVVNNVETFSNIPFIVGDGADSYAGMGTKASPGTKTLCFNHGFTHPGIVEVEFGTPLQQAIDAVGGSKEPLAAILLGGPMGCVVPPELWNTPICYQAMQQRGLDLGHGNIIALPQSADKTALLRHWLAFMADESCGKCEPCSLGSRKSSQLASQSLTPQTRAELDALLHLISQTSLCAFGREIPRAVSHYLELFADEILTSAPS